jgi:hypothetical protein
MTDDPKTPKQVLVVAGQVQRFATISPGKVILRGAAGTPLKARTLITPIKRYPFKVLDVRARNGRHIRYDLTARNDGTGGYALTVENLRPDPGHYFDTILLTTDSPIRPEIPIGVYANITKPDPKKK